MLGDEVVPDGLRHPGRAGRGRRAGAGGSAAAQRASAACRSARSALPTPAYAASRISGVAKTYPPRVRCSIRRCSSSSTARSSSTRGHRGRPAVRPGAPLAQRLQRAGRHGVADHGGVPQHRPGLGRQRVDPGGEDRGQVPGEQPAAQRAGHQPPAGRPSGAVAVPPARGQRAALDQQRDQFGQVERVALGGGEQPVGVGLRQLAAAEIGGEQPGRVGAAQRRQRVHLGVGDPGQGAGGADQLRPAEQHAPAPGRRAGTASRRARRSSPAVASCRSSTMITSGASAASALSSSATAVGTASASGVAARGRPTRSGLARAAVRSAGSSA